MLYIHAHLSVCPRVFSRQTFSMFLSGGLYCLLFFPLIQGRHETLSGDRLVGLSQRDRSLCHLVAGDHSAHSLSFLARLRGFNDRPVLFQSSWSRQGQLEQCIFWQEATITSAYLAFCREKRGKPLSTGTFLTEWDSRLDTALRDLEQWARNCSSPLLSAAGPESLRGRRSAALAPLGKPDSPGSASFLQNHRPGARRGRRTLTFPGTVWCGPGNSAENFTDLGIFDQTDLCCRAHDHCEHILSAFEYNYGVWNFRLHTISHCDCDYRFRRCLLNVNDTISTVVGIAFFNVLQVPCFNLEPDGSCIKKTQRSHCNITERTLRAVLRSQPRYNYTHPILDEFQMGLESKTTASSAATSSQNQIITSLSTGSTTHGTLAKSTQKVKSINKKCHKCKGHQKKKTKANSQIILKAKADMMPTMVPTELAFKPATEQNSVPVAMEKKDGPRKLLQRNISDALLNQVNGTVAVGLDKNNSKEHSFTILGRQNTATSLSKSVESTTLSSKNQTGIKLAKTMYNIKNTVSSSFISSRKAFDLSSFSKNSSLKSLPSGSARKGHAPRNLPCRMGNWNHSEIIISSPCAHQTLDPIRPRPTAPKGKSRGCNIYKALDRCEHKISPQEFKFSYHNQQSRTLYHCDCLKRLAKKMKKHVNVSTAEWLLTEFVSQSCFWLKSVPRNCSNEEWRHCATQSGSTVAVLSKPRHLQRILQHLGILDEYLNLLTDEQERYKNGTSNVTNSVKLYDKCLQLIQA